MQLQTLMLVTFSRSSIRAGCTTAGGEPTKVAAAGADGMDTESF